MYKLGEMYSAIKSGIGSIPRTMAAAGLVAVVTGCATPQKPLVPLAQNTPNSVVLENGERIYDISGCWDAKYSDTYGGQEVKITQNGRKVVGVKTKGDHYVRSGESTIQASVKHNGFESVEAYHSGKGWLSSSGEISKEGREIHISNFDFRIELKRKERCKY